MHVRTYLCKTGMNKNWVHVRMYVNPPQQPFVIYSSVMKCVGVFMVCMCIFSAWKVLHTYVRDLLLFIEYVEKRFEGAGCLIVEARIGELWYICM